jgi:hypothetical protein
MEAKANAAKVSNPSSPVPKPAQSQDRPLLDFFDANDKGMTGANNGVSGSVWNDNDEFAKLAAGNSMTQQAVQSQINATSALLTTANPFMVAQPTGIASNPFAAAVPNPAIGLNYSSPASVTQNFNSFSSAPPTQPLISVTNTGLTNPFMFNGTQNQGFGNGFAVNPGNLGGFDSANKFNSNTGNASMLTPVNEHFTGNFGTALTSNPFSAEPTMAPQHTGMISNAVNPSITGWSNANSQKQPMQMQLTGNSIVSSTVGFNNNTKSPMIGAGSTRQSASPSPLTGERYGTITSASNPFGGINTPFMTAQPLYPQATGSSQFTGPIYPQATGFSQISYPPATGTVQMGNGLNPQLTGTSQYSGGFYPNHANNLAPGNLPSISETPSVAGGKNPFSSTSTQPISNRGNNNPFVA